MVGIALCAGLKCNPAADKNNFDHPPDVPAFVAKLGRTEAPKPAAASEARSSNEAAAPQERQAPPPQAKAAAARIRIERTLLRLEREVVTRQPDPQQPSQAEKTTCQQRPATPAPSCWPTEEELFDEGTLDAMCREALLHAELRGDPREEEEVRASIIKVERDRRLRETAKPPPPSNTEKGAAPPAAAPPPLAAPQEQAASSNAQFSASDAVGREYVYRGANAPPETGKVGEPQSEHN